MNKYAYKLGFSMALQDAGLTKLAGRLGFDLPQSERLDRATPRFSQSGSQSPKKFREHQKERHTLTGDMNRGIAYMREHGVPPSNVTVGPFPEPSEKWKSFMQKLLPPEKKTPPVVAQKPEKRPSGFRDAPPATRAPETKQQVASAPASKPAAPAPTGTVEEMLSGVEKMEYPPLKEPTSAGSIRY